MKILFVLIFVIGFAVTQANTEKNVSQDGDIYFKTCSSNATKAHLTVFYESVNKKADPLKIVFSIHGSPLTYTTAPKKSNPATGTLEKGSCEGASCSEIQVSPDGEVVVKQKNKTVLSFTMATNDVRVLKGSRDPRYKARRIKKSIGLHCRDFAALTQ